MRPDTYLYIILAIICVGFAIDRTLAFLNLKYWSEEIPEELQDHYNEEKYLKARRYQLEKTRFSMITSSITFVVTLTVIITGALGWLDNKTAALTESDYTYSALFFFTLFITMDILSLPFSIYGTFVIEEKFGFNKTTVPTFINDKLKSYLLMILIGGPLLYLIMMIYQQTAEMFWIYAWIVIGLFMLFMTSFYTSLILPLFNKLSPLENGELRNMIESYCEKVGYDLRHIYVMDGSKRSAKANAFFSGLGKRKTIVLFDTLIEKQTNEELVAILAHEIGHYKKKHTLTSVIIGILQMGLILYLLSFFLTDDNLAKALGADETSFHIALIGFSMIFSPVSEITGIFMNVLSRKNEFEADAYAKKTYSGRYLAEGLKKLSADSLSNIYPHPAYVFVNYSHPPVLERLKALKEK